MGRLDADDRSLVRELAKVFAPPLPEDFGPAGLGDEVGPRAAG